MKANKKVIKDGKVCLVRAQLENIVDAAQHKPNACPKAKEFVHQLLKERKEKTQKKAVSIWAKLSKKLRL